MTDYGAFFAAGAGIQASQRSTPGIFDADVRAQPCRFPCSNPAHIHAEDLPANRVNRANHPHHERPYLTSDPSEVRE